jgi:P-type E1-E2 ATPase
VQIAGRKAFHSLSTGGGELPDASEGLECLVAIEGRYAGLLRFRDEPRVEGRRFVGHLRARHGITRTLLVSGDRDTEVRYLASKVAIERVYAGQSPEEKLALVRDETRQAPTIFVGDGINDAPALAAATVGVAFGSAVDVAGEAASVVVMDQSLERVDELLHIGRRMRAIALQSAVGGMALSAIGMIAAASGTLPPVRGALLQEVIDVLAVMNALRGSWAPRVLSDY